MISADCFGWKFIYCIWKEHKEKVSRTQNLGFKHVTRLSTTRPSHISLLMELVQCTSLTEGKNTKKITRYAQCIITSIFYVYWQIHQRNNLRKLKNEYSRTSHRYLYPNYTNRKKLLALEHLLQTETALCINISMQ